MPVPAVGVTKGEMLRGLVFAPLLEEIYFRSICTAVMYGVACSGKLDDGTCAIQPYEVMLWTSVLFGLSHVHHVLDEASVAEVAVMFLYTGLFGAFASAVLLATGHIVAPILSHVSAIEISFFFTASRSLLLLVPASEADGQQSPPCVITTT